MKQFLMIILLSVTSLIYSKENSLNEYCLSGLKYFEDKQYAEAKEMFTAAINNMSNDERQQNTDVLFHMASTNYLLGDYDNVLTQAEELISCPYLSDQEKLQCGNLIVSSFWKKGMEEKAIEAYFNYIASSPIAPKCLFEENKIIVKNAPQCEECKKSAVPFLINKFCEKEEDFQEYGNIWVIRLTKKCDCFNKESHRDQNARLKDGTKRTPEVIRACCNTCSTLAVSAGVACGRILHFGCRTFCLLFVETCRQVCEGCCYHGGVEEKCWENFSFWKDDFQRQNPDCTIPMI